MTEAEKERFKGICCIELSGEDCGACLSLMPVLNRLTEGRTDLKLVHVEVNADSRELVTGWGVDRVPTVLLTDDGEPFARCHGFQPEEILDLWIESKLEEHKKAKNQCKRS